MINNLLETTQETRENESMKTKKNTGKSQVEVYRLRREISFLKLKLVTNASLGVPSSSALGQIRRMERKLRFG